MERNFAEGGLRIDGLAVERGWPGRPLAWLGRKKNALIGAGLLTLRLVPIHWAIGSIASGRDKDGTD